MTQRTTMSGTFDSDSDLIARACAAVCGSAARGVARDSPTAADRPQIAGYELVREVGRGGQGVVYQARQCSTQRDVAIKMLRHGILASRAEHARLHREVRILAQLRHPGIVTIHDSGQAGGLSYVVMDYIDGVALDAHLADARLTLRERVALFAQIAEAVSAAHQRDVIHRDLKPANIRVDADGLPHILDFGVAKLLTTDAPAASLTQTGQFVGSLQWSAPEQACGQQAAVDARSDVYSLGVVFWCGLTGAFPYPVDGDVSRVLASVLNVEPCRTGRTGERLPFDVETILRRCLAKDPQRRYRHAGELAEDLRRFLADRPVAARRDSGLYVLRKTISRHPIVAGLAAALLVGTATAAVALGVLYRASEAARREVEFANHDLRRDLFATVPSLSSLQLTFDDERLDERFLRTGDFELTDGRLVAACESADEAACTLMPSRAVLRGDFDISLDYEIEQGLPLEAGAVQCALHLVDVRQGHYVNWLARYSEKNPQCPGMPEDVYVAGGSGNCPPGRAATSHRAGRLRMVRRGSIATAYYFDQTWCELYRAPVPDGVLGVEIVVRRQLTAAPLRVALDNLFVRTAFPSAPECLEPLHDEFAGTQIDARFLVKGAFGGPVESQGLLRSGKQNGYRGGNSITLDPARFRLCGDFELSVEYLLANWPEPADGEHVVGLALMTLSDAQRVAAVERVRDARGPQGAPRDSVRARSVAATRETPAAAGQGALRLVRRGAEIEMSHWDGAWHELASAPITKHELVFQVYSEATDTSRKHEVHFDNLRCEPR